MTADDPGKSIAIVMRDPFIQAVLIDALKMEEYAVTVLTSGPRLVDEITRLVPHALLLELGTHGENLDMLDALRNTPETNRTAVITLGLSASFQEQAQASGNVHTSLPMPFDLSDLFAAIDDAVSHRPAEDRILAQPIEPEGSYRRAADLLTRSERDIMLRWVTKARSVSPFAGRPDISPEEFLDALPRVLNMVILALRHQEPPQALSEYDETRRRIEQHAIQRYRVGLPIEATAYEYHILREAIRDRLRRDMTPEEVLDILGKLHSLLDDATRIALATYHRTALIEPPDMTAM